MSRGNPNGDSGRHDADALIFGFAISLAILLAFAVCICIIGCVGYRRYQSDQIKRRKFVNRNIPSKKYSADNGRANQAKEPTGEDESKQEIQECALPVESHEPEDDDVCSICLVPYKNRDKISWSNEGCCPHTYHKKCISEWLYMHTECPMCRAVFLGDDKEQEGVDEGGLVSEDADVETGASEREPPNTPSHAEDENFA